MKKLILSALVGIYFILNSAQAQRLIWLGTLGGSRSIAYGVSADGSVVVGWAYNTSGQIRAFRWTAQTGMQDLGTLGGDWSQALSVSADGSVVVGSAGNASGQGRAFRWTAQAGMQDLGTLGGAESAAYGVSADGSVVVGWAYNTSGNSRAFRWTAQTGMQDLGTLPGYVESLSYGVSTDGSVVVEWAYNASGNSRAFRWTAQTGMQDLGTLPGYEYGITAYGVSTDGSVVVGGAENANYQRHAFRWMAQIGMQDLNQIYASLLQDGSYLRSAIAISPNGRYIVGGGYNAATGRDEAYLLDTQGATSVESENMIKPASFYLFEPWPNPFRDEIQVQFSLPSQSRVQVVVYDILGRVVKVLYDGELGSGIHGFSWDGRDSQGQSLPTGVYLLQLRANAKAQIKRLMLMR